MTDRELHSKLYEMEVTPPVEVWANLSATLDEINADFSMADKIKNIKVAPPAEVWEIISNRLPDVKEKKSGTTGFVFYFKRFAAAAVIIGIIITIWIVFNKNNHTNTGVASKKNQTEKNVSAKGNNPSTNNESQNQLQDTASPGTDKNLLTTATQTKKAVKKKNKNPGAFKPEYREESMAVINKQKPGGNKFTSPIDDLSMVGDGEHYLTMVNANGRLVKITPELAHLAPRLQDKPITGDIYEIMFGEGEYWKETLSEWRKKLALSPAGSGDVFSSLIELLKTVDNN